MMPLRGGTAPSAPPAMSGRQNMLDRTARQNQPQGLGDEQKQPQDQVNYRPAEDPQVACSQCEYFQPPDGCSKVLGKISPTDVCDLFESMSEDQNQPGGEMQ